MRMETIEAFSMSLATIIYLLVERAGMVKLLPSPRAKFLAPGLVALVITMLAFLAADPRPPFWRLLVDWLGLWVASIMVKATVKDNEARRPPDRTA